MEQKHQKYEHILPADIERTSMGIITEELRQQGIRIVEEHEAVVRRVIHTTADFEYAENLHFTRGAVAEGIRAMAEKPVIITDTNMALAGISKPSLARLSGRAVCYMAEPFIAEAAKVEGKTRAAASMEYAVAEHPHGIFAIGNAPTALITLSRWIEKGMRPSLIIGVPVGFVNVVESKEEIFNICRQYHVPAIVAMGRKGGSNVAAAICNALLYAACDTLDPGKRGWMG